MKNWKILNEIAKDLFDEKKFDLAIQTLNHPDLPIELYPNIAKCYYYYKQASTALSYIETWQDKNDNIDTNPKAWHESKIDQALYLNALGNHDDAKKILESLDSSDPKVLFNLGWHYLRDGRFSSGFGLLKYGSKCRAWGNEYQYTERGILDQKKKYDSSNLIGDEVLLFILEGGLGDQIAFLRWVNHYDSNDVNTIVACDPSLMRLLTNHGYNCIPHSEIKNTYHDVYIPSMSIPALDTNISSPQTSVVFPYIEIPVDKYIQKVIDKTNTQNQLKIGIKWFGNPEFEHDQFRTLPEDSLKEITSSHGKVYSLQFEDDDEEIPNCKHLIRDWQDTYSVIKSLDIVVTSCTSIAHLCGAMNHPCIVMVPLVPYFTWACNEMSWYKSVTIIRQTKYNNWSEAFNQLDRKLKKLEIRNLNERFDEYI